MAFPTGYTKYQEITIDYTKVSADQTDFIVYVNLADLVKAGADIFDTCRTDGGDIRATKTDGTTELAVEVVAIDTTAKTGEVHIKFTGTLSSTVNTVIRIWYNGTDTLPAFTDTYGRNAVWSGYGVVLHMGNTVNSTGNTAMTLIGSPSVGAGKVGNGYTFSDASNQYGYVPDEASNSPTGNLELSTWINYTTLPTSGIVDGILTKDTGATSQRSFWADYYNNGGTKQLRLGIHVDGGASNFAYSTHNYNFTTGTPTMVVFRTTPANAIATKFEFIINGASVGNGSGASAGSGATSIYNSTTDFIIGRYSGTYPETDALFDEVRLYAGNRANSWHTTEYNNQNSPSTFYATGNEVGASGDVSTTPSALVATFSLPASTVTATQDVTVSPSALVCTFSTPAPDITGDSSVAPAVLVATFSIPTADIITPDANVSPSVLVATFSLPTATISVEANALVDSSVLSATFSIPAPTVTVTTGVDVYPDVLTATFSTPAPTVDVVSSITVSPEVLVATFTLPLARVISDFWEDKFPVLSDPFVDKVYNAGDNWTDKY